MIKLNRSFTPLFCKPDNVQSLTQEFIKEGRNVWNNEELKNALLKLSHAKCAYCECKLDEESKYMEVEHFEDKNNNPNKVLEWENLLPACKRCNASKGTHDVTSNPIINPFKIDPVNHLKLRLYRFKKKTNVGRNTIDVLDLNNSERTVNRRFQIGNAIQDSLDEAFEKFERYKNNGSTRSKNILLAHMEGLLNECLPTSEYSATTASVVHSEESYKKLKEEMIQLSQWPSYLQKKHEESLKIVLECS